MISVKDVDLVEDAYSSDSCDSMNRGNVRFQAKGTYDGKSVLVVWEFPKDLMPEDADLGSLDWDNDDYATVKYLEE